MAAAAALLLAACGTNSPCPEGSTANSKGVCVAIETTDAPDPDDSTDGAGTAGHGAAGNNSGGGATDGGMDYRGPCDMGADISGCLTGNDGELALSVCTAVGWVSVPCPACPAGNTTCGDDPADMYTYSVCYCTGGDQPDGDATGDPCPGYDGSDGCCWDNNP